jgi:hypothetical protein
VSACFECDVDHHAECPSIGEEDFSIDADEDGWYTIFCCCGVAVDTAQTTAAEYAEYAEELRQRGWSQPTDPGMPPGVGG